MVGRKADKLQAMFGSIDGSPIQLASPTPPKTHFKRGEESSMTPKQFLQLGMESFTCELDGSHKVEYTLFRKTNFCLTYVATIPFQDEVVIAPVYIFKKTSSLQRYLMQRIYFMTEEEPFQVISGSHYHHEHGEQVIRNQIDPFLVPLRRYFGFKLYSPISDSLRRRV